MSAWISNHMSSKVWDEVTYSFPKFNGATIEVTSVFANNENQCDFDVNSLRSSDAYMRR